MSCSYTYPTGHTVNATFWMKNRLEGLETSGMSEDPAYKIRVEYLGNKQNNCSMKLTNVTGQDAKRYFFRFTTNYTSGKWIGEPGVQMSVTDLQVETPERVMEGETVTLKCNTTCSLSNTSTFIWYKNGRVLTRKTMKNNELSLQSVSYEDRGSYMCAVQGHENLPSPAVTLTVTYPPKKTTVSVSASGEIVAGSSVTLTCSSDANPPQINYTWYKESVTSPVGYGQSYIINNIQSSNSGLYYCEAQNKHGSQKTTAVLVTLKDRPKKTTVSVSPPREIVEGSSVTLICSSDANPPATYIWYKKNGSVTIGKEETYRINKISSEDSGEYQCKSSNQHGEHFATVFLNVHYATEKTTVSVSPSGEIVEGSSVTLTCSSDANPPATYIWYKKNGSVTIGKEETYRINKISSEDSGEYQCKSSNQHGEHFATVFLNVHHAPKKTTVSVSSTGEIVEGSSVTLTCSSDANPPATYIWYKKNGSVTIGKEETYRINKISSEDSGEYHCKSSNQHGHQYSNTVSLNVLYPPRNTTVSVNASGEIVEGSSVTLTCSSDANPPQINYTWYKENVTSPVGYGQSYIINNIQSSNSGLYYCEAQNKHGSQKTTAVPITMKGIHGQSWGVKYNRDSICALKGSSVTMSCSYTYPTSNTVKTVFWTKHEVGEPSDLSEDIDYKGKFHDLGDKQSNCTMKLINVTQTDSKRYRFRFTTDKARWIGQPGVTLSVTGYGQRYIINNIQSSNSGLYYCEAQNKHGSQKTTAVPITVKGMETVIAVVI
ncbi:B-cell receptor CD22-like [Chanos chanos]|uniref:B-cell receptor CD22-like n=1 Tax=Chanos chanos TaxID=29144 RepID=A0A6J2VTE1_CHACN|nr:B-cell receptor CD22-like [Chanos chanos]